MCALSSKRKRYTVDISVKDVYKKSFYNLIEEIFCQHDRISVTLLRFPNNRRSHDEDINNQFLSQLLSFNC